MLCLAPALIASCGRGTSSALEELHVPSEALQYATTREEYGRASGRFLAAAGDLLRNKRYNSRAVCAVVAFGFHRACEEGPVVLRETSARIAVGFAEMGLLLEGNAKDYNWCLNLLALSAATIGDEELAMSALSRFEQVESDRSFALEMRRHVARLLQEATSSPKQEESKLGH